MVNGHYVLPFDFKNFDHQLWKHEIKKLVSLSHMIVLSNATDTVRKVFRIASNIVLRSIDDATLQDSPPPSHGTNIYKVLNGLLSGMRGTSNIGNGFNLSMYEMVLFFLELILLLGNFIPVAEIRGDDLRITTKNQYLLILIYYIYKAIGIKANPSKFGLCYRRGDFLCLDCDHKTGMTGLPARTTPSITQRKPWKGAQWVGESRLTAVCHNMYNIMRRVEEPSSPEVHSRFQTAIKIICRRWSHAMRLSPEYANIPISIGGLGQWDCRTFISTKGDKIPVNMFE